MILRGGKRKCVLAVAQREERGFFAGHEFLDHDFRAGAARPPANIMSTASSASSSVMATTTPLPAASPSALIDDRRTLRPDIGFCGVRIAEAFITRGRNVVGLAEVLGEPFGALQLSRGPAWPERLDAGSGEIVDDAGDQRRFRTDHDEIDRVGPAEIDHCGMVGNVQRDAFGFPCDPGIAGRAPQFCDQRGSRDLPRQRVFAAAGPEQEDVHACRLANPRAGHKRTGAFSAPDLSFLKARMASYNTAHVALHPQKQMTTPNNTPHIRAATAVDAARMRAIARAAYAKYVPRIGREPLPMGADYEAEVAANRAVVIETAGSVLGYMIAWPEPDAYLIDNIGVDPACQGIGLGRRLIDHAVSQADGLGLPALRLFTNALMSENLAMYAHIGFVETHRSVEKGFHRVYMRWIFLTEHDDSIRRGPRFLSDDPIKG